MTTAMRTHLLRDFLVGLGYIVLIVALIAVAVLVYNKDFSDTVDVTLATGDVGSSLQKGADVEVRGVVVGSVSSISTNGVTAHVGLALSPAQAGRLPANVTAQLLPKTLFGQRYVNLVIPARQSAQHVRSGDVIRPDTSTTNAEIQDVFAHLLPVLQAVRPAKLAETLGAISASLRGEGADLGATLQTLSGYLKKFAPQVPTMLRDIRRFASVATTYQGAAPDLLAALRNFTATSRTLVRQRTQFAALLRSVTSASGRIGGFLEANSGDLIGLSRSSLPTLRVLAHYSGEFPCLSRALTDFIPVMNSALGKGTDEPGLHVTMQVVPARTPYRSTTGYDASGGPSCPQVTAAESSATALGTGLSRIGGIGTVNSPQENQVIAELVAPSTGRTPADFPHWGSLLLGPALRGTTVTLR